MNGRRAVIALAAVFSGLSRAFAGAGESGFQFLEIGAAPRQAAMGQAAAASGDDADAAAWNPAALGEVRRSALSLSSMRYAAGSSYHSFSYARPFQNRGAAALRVESLDYGAVPGYDGTGAPAGSVDAGDFLLSAGAGFPAGEEWTFGAALKQVQERLGDAEAKALAADAGALYRPAWTGWASHWRAGVSLTNAGGGAVFGRRNTPLPRAWRAGLAYQAFSGALTLAADTERPRGEKGSFCAGGEVWLNGSLALRAGWREGDALARGASAGMGFRFRDVQLDYAWSGSDRGFDDSHRFGITYRFGGAAEALYQQGLRLARQGNHGEAILRFNDVLQIDKRHRGAIRGLREAAEALKQEREQERDRKSGEEP